MRTASPIGITKTLPSPMEPVLAALQIDATSLSTRASGTTTSTLTLGKKSIVYSEPRYSSVWPFWRPKPRTSVTVMPRMPCSWSASFTSSSLNGLITASIFFMQYLPLLGASDLERLAVESGVLAGRGLPGEILRHGALDKRSPERGLAVGGGGAANRVEQRLDGERVEDEAGPRSAGGIELRDGVGEPARAPDDGRRPVPERDELPEPAGLV